jgi:kynurenine formamidase
MDVSAPRGSDAMQLLDLKHLRFDSSASHYAAGTEFSIGRLSLVANTGTYLDTPGSPLPQWP